MRWLRSSAAVLVVLSFHFVSSGVTAQNGEGRVTVRIVTDEPDAVLSILRKREKGQTLTESDWQWLFSTEGYVRLKKRETSMGRPFEDSSFRHFVLSDSMINRFHSLFAIVESWKTADVGAAADRVLGYLPRDAFIRAAIYPVIKPRSNSFVFEVRTDPAIFLYVDPVKSRDEFENTLAHELHHIGYGTACPSEKDSGEISNLPVNVRNVVDWIGGFGEGLAMLAAAGGPDRHPHASSPKEDRERWDKDMMNFNEDLKKVARFFADVLYDRLTDEKRNETGFSFFGIQGPWYTVGWRMAALIEKTYGRSALINCMCDPRQLLSTYNRAALLYNGTTPDTLALWPSSLLQAMTPKPE